MQNDHLSEIGVILFLNSNEAIQNLRSLKYGNFYLL